jgi:hypothetical protein
MGGVAAEIPNVLVAADGPEARAAPMDGRFGAELRQHIEVAVPKEERSVAGVNLREVDLVPLVPGHAPSVLCCAMQTPSPEYRPISGA